jgi:hypothetical protein
MQRKGKDSRNEHEKSHAIQFMLEIYKEREESYIT